MPGSKKTMFTKKSCAETRAEKRKLAHRDVEVESTKALCARAQRSSRLVLATSSRKRLHRGHGPVLP